MAIQIPYNRMGGLMPELIGLDQRNIGSVSYGGYNVSRITIPGHVQSYPIYYSNEAIPKSQFGKKVATLSANNSAQFHSTGKDAIVEEQPGIGFSEQTGRTVMSKLKEEAAIEGIGAVGAIGAAVVIVAIVIAVVVGVVAIGIISTWGAVQQDFAKVDLVWAKKAHSETCLKRNVDGDCILWSINSADGSSYVVDANGNIDQTGGPTIPQELTNEQKIGVAAVIVAGIAAIAGVSAYTYSKKGKRGR